MANQQNYNYEEFNIPYNNNMERTDSIPSENILDSYGADIVNSPVGLGSNVIDGQSVGNFRIRNWMKSQNYKPKTKGFLIHGELGYIECMQLYVGDGGIVGGSLDIPNTTKADSFHVAADGTTWWGTNTALGYATAPAYILPTGDALFNNVTIHGRNGQALANAINSDANLITEVINDKLNTSTEEILGDYTFGSVGSIMMINDSNNGIWLSPSGILGKKDGTPTFTITTSGDATFAGELNAAFGTFGTISAGALVGTLTVGGLLATTIGSSINSSGYFISQVINGKIDTSSQEILKDFDFGSTDYAGAVKAGDITWNSSGVITSGSGVAIYRKGIVGAEDGEATFSISTSGEAFFKGDIGSGSEITAPIITGGIVTGTEIYGGYIVAGTEPDHYIVLSDTAHDGRYPPYEPYLRGFIDDARAMQLDNNSLEFFDTNSIKLSEFNDAGLKFYDSAAQNIANIEIAPAFYDILGSFTVETIKNNNLILGTTYSTSARLSGVEDTPGIYVKARKSGGFDSNICALGVWPMGASDTVCTALIMRPHDDIGEDGATMVISSHYMAQYYNFCTDLGLGDDGVGFRVNSGTGKIEYKDVGGSWTALTP